MVRKISNENEMVCISLKELLENEHQHLKYSGTIIHTTEEGKDY